MQKLAAFLKRFHSGPAADAYEYLGCHTHEDGEGYVFRVWAPHAQSVCVVGDFNFWNTEDLPMRKISEGVWEAVSVYAKAGQAYKYRPGRPHSLQDRPVREPLLRAAGHLQHDRSAGRLRVA